MQSYSSKDKPKFKFRVGQRVRLMTESGPVGTRRRTLAIVEIKSHRFHADCEPSYRVSGYTTAFWQSQLRPLSRRKKVGKEMEVPRLNVGELDGQSLIEMNNLAVGYMQEPLPNYIIAQSQQHGGVTVKHSASDLREHDYAEGRTCWCGETNPVHMHVQKPHVEHGVRSGEAGAEHRTLALRLIEKITEGAVSLTLSRMPEDAVDRVEKEIFEDVRDCLIDEELGCLDPEELDETNSTLI